MKFEYMNFEGTFLPIVPIRLKGKEWVRFLAYLDSGASYKSCGNTMNIPIQVFFCSPSNPSKRWY